jgi:dTMP kinase
MIISIEGVDGVGKTKVAKALAGRLHICYQKFPDRTTESGKLLAAVLQGQARIHPVAFQALQIANRLEQLPLLHHAYQGGTHLVCDRYTLSGAVYGRLEGLRMGWLLSMLRAVPAANVEVLLTCDVKKLDGERLAGRDREMYETGGVERLAQTQSKFEGFFETRETNRRARWLKYDTTYVAPEIIAKRIADTLKGCFV